MTSCLSESHDILLYKCITLCDRQYLAQQIINLKIFNLKAVMPLLKVNIHFFMGDYSNIKSNDCSQDHKSNRKRKLGLVGVCYHQHFAILI